MLIKTILSPNARSTNTKSYINRLSPVRMRKKYTRVNILRCVDILQCANQPVSKFKLRLHGAYHQACFCM